jgi:alkylation response protein AidB-like acyl-CoA dehydrogenase
MISLEATLDPENARFRDEVRHFLATEFTPELRAESRRQTGLFAHADLGRRWHRILHEKGWIAPTWPKRFGGAELSITQQYILSEECGLAGTPVLPGMGLQMCGPVLMKYGTPAQQEHFLPRILSGEHYWCQGYSEPQAGSDLASLRCRAERSGDMYVVNGQKIWTTHAHFANWIFLLVRTSTEGRPQAGITFLVAPMDTPGITVRPILSMSGEHEVNEVFFDDVHIPVENCIGGENQGWTVAKFLLLNERSGSSGATVLKAAYARLLDIVSTSDNHFADILADPQFRHSLADVEIDILAIEAMERETMAAMARGEAILDDFMASVQKLRVTETLQRITEMEVEAIGRFALIDQAGAIFGEVPNGSPSQALRPVAQFLNMRACTIFGGSSEVQRNILARVALGL